MNELTLTAFSCSILTTLRYADKGTAKLIRVFCTSLSLAFFLGEDVANIVQLVFSFEVSRGGVICLLSLLGTELIEKLIFVIKTFNINKLWNK